MGSDHSAASQPRVAVITGAGSGIGRELALACARERMIVVAVDIERPALQETQEMVRALGANCAVHPCDVADAVAVEHLADVCWRDFGGTDWLFNNAGVAKLGRVWEATQADWDWVLGVNLMGVANGVRAFVPRMLARGTPAHIVNTASAAGLATLAGSGVYCASKHGVVALSECLAHDLAAVGSSIGVSVLCPSLLPSKINEAERNRPAALANAGPESDGMKERVRIGMANSTISAADAARETLRAIKHGRFYVLPHSHTGDAVRKRTDSILSDFRWAHSRAE